MTFLVSVSRKKVMPGTTMPSVCNVLMSVHHFQILHNVRDRRAGESLSDGTVLSSILASMLYYI